VGGILTFLPQIAILFLFLAVLEDCGYMARAAFLMDSMMTRVGLSGQSFIPLLSSFGCAIPGIMATRVIGDRRDRLTTILIAPLMTCSARLPIYALLIAAFIPGTTYLGGLVSLQGLTLSALYGLGIVSAMVVARVLKRTLLRGQAPPFFMELPSYKWPSARTVGHRILERVVAFLRFAGSVILAVSILVWAALYYPHGSEVAAPLEAQKQPLQARLAALDARDPARTKLETELALLDRDIAGAYQRQSFLGRFGRLLEPVVRPLGWDWRIGSAVIASLPAREIIVATLGVIFNLEGDAPGEDNSAGEKLRGVTRDDGPAPLFNIPVALSIMVFYALCAQCAATLAVIRQETNSWRWPVLTFAYMTGLAYVGALVTYQAGAWIGGL
jgi:ferrous iron transport protein B